MGFWRILGIAWASWRSKGFSWAKLVSNILKYVTNDVQKVGWAEAKGFVTGHV